MGLKKRVGVTDLFLKKVVVRETTFFCIDYPGTGDGSIDLA